MVKSISLTCGKSALVDDADFDILTNFKWRASPRVNNCYAVTTLPAAPGGGMRSTVSMHRMLMGCTEFVDHKDGDGLNNQRANLRPATAAENQANRKKMTAPTSSSFKGVYWEKVRRKWRAQIRLDQRSVHIGWFSDEVTAARAYDAAARKWFGEFARCNFGN